MVLERISGHESERICIHAPNWVGDVVMATPLFRCVRHHFPASHILLVVREKVAPVLRCAPWFDRVLTYRPTLWNAPAQFLRCAKCLRAGNFDLGLILPNSFNTALMFFLGGVRVRVGYVRDARARLLTHRLPRASSGGTFKPTYMVAYYLGLCRALGLEPYGTQTELHFGTQDMAQTRRILREAGVNPAKPLFLLHPGSGFGPSKRWPEANFARLAEMLQDNYVVQICVIGSRQEGPTARLIQHLSGAKLFDLTGAGIDLHLLKCLVSLSSLLVTTDSGPRHYGVALGVPTVCIMGPTHPDYSTSERPNDMVVRTQVECGPCQKKVCKLDHRCMERISPDMVFSFCSEALLAGSLQAHDRA